MRRQSAIALLLAAGLALLASGTAMEQGQARPPEPKEPGDRKERTDADGDPLPPRVLVRMGSRRLRSKDCPLALAYSPDGKLLAGANAEEPWVFVWELPSGKLRHRLPSVAAVERRLLFAPDGERLASVGLGLKGAGCPIQVWEAATGKELMQGELYNHWGGLALAFSADGESVATSSIKDSVRLWSVRSGKEEKQFDSPLGQIRALAFTGPEKLVAVAVDKDSVGVWDIGAETKKRYGFAGPTGGVEAVAFSRDHKTFALEGPDFSVALRQTDDGNVVHRLKGHKAAVCSLNFSADGKGLASGGKDGTLRLWDLEGGAERHALTLAANALPFGVFAPDGKTLASGGAGHAHRVRLWDVATGKEQPPPAGHDAAVSAIAFTPDGRRLASASVLRGDETVRLWDAETGRQVRAIAGHKGGAASLAFSPDGKLLATADWQEPGNVYLWDVESGDRRRLIEGLGAGVIVAFSADGKRLAGADAFANRDGGCAVRAWEVDGGKKVLHVDRAKEQGAQSAAFAPDGRTLTLGDAELHSIDLKSGKERAWPARPWGRARTVVYSRDGRTLVETFGNVKSSLWETASQREIWELMPAGAAAAISPDGRFVAVGMKNGGIALVDVKSRERLLTLGEAGDRVSALAFAPDGKRLAAGADDSTCLIWDVSDLPTLAAHGDRDLDEDGLAQAWDELGLLDPRPAFRASWDLSRAGNKAVRLLQTKLSAVDEAMARRIAKLIAQLDDDEFAVREKATEELAKIGAEADEALQAALKGASAEARKRIESILENRAGSANGTNDLRARRALAVLERVGTAEAKALLRKLAGGAADAPLTLEAKAALDRLARRP
jgi:WD40 repeat protein